MPPIHPEHQSEPMPAAPTPVAPIQTAPVPATPHKHHSPAVQIVWQWLCYSLWEWALISLSVLLSATLVYFMVNKDNDYEFVAYTLAVMLVLVPMAFVAERFYSKQEPPEKHGFAAVVLVLNAVLVFLATLAGLITAIVALLSMFLSSGDNSGRKVTVISSLIVALLGGMLFARIMNPPRLQKFKKLFPLIVSGIAGLAIVLSFAGPFRTQISTKNDRLIEDNLSSLNRTVQDYARTKGSLPTGLSDLDLTNEGDAKSLVDKKLVDYRVVNKDPVIYPTVKGGINYEQNLALKSATYELCVTYQRAKGSNSYRNQRTDYMYIDTYSHPAGRQCYTQHATLESISPVTN